MNRMIILRVIGILLILLSSYLYISYFLAWMQDGGVAPLGENMVNNEIIIINNIIMFKPITLAMITGALGYIITLESANMPLTNQKRLWIAKLSKIVAFVFLIISGYEFTFNMMIWSAYIVLHGNNVNVDKIYTHFPYSQYSWNIVFATKLFFMILIMAIATIYYISRWEQNK